MLHFLISFELVNVKEGIFSGLKYVLGVERKKRIWPSTYQDFIAFLKSYNR